MRDVPVSITLLQPFPSFNCKDVFFPSSARLNHPFFLFSCLTFIDTFQVAACIAEGLRHESSIHCDALMSLPKSILTNYAGYLSPAKLLELKKALIAALALDDDE